MSKEELTKYREKFIKDMSVYPRAIFYEMRANNFGIARKFFGEEVYRTRVHKYQNMDVTEKILFFQYHLAKMSVCDDVMDYLETFKNLNK